MLFTRCPNCHQKQQLTAEQLRITRAIFYCPHCALAFDALEQLSDTDPDAKDSPELPIDSARDAKTVSTDSPTDVGDAPATLPWERPARVANPHWKTGVWLGLLALAGQLMYFHGGVIGKNTTLRRWCLTLGCPLATYQNANELAIVQSALEPLPDQGHLFKATITNRAAFTQAYPAIDLILLDYAGNAIARRRFRPDDYLINPKASAIAPEAAVELRLHLAPTNLAVGGYTFDLTY